MLSLPLVIRELRVESRKRTTYSARTGWGLAAVALLGFFALNFPNQSANGRYMLSAVHFCLAIMLFLVAPLGASDAISREKREGTLGLLLLTELTPIEVVLGKLAAHFLRLFYLALMMLPFLMLPVLLGGVGFQDFLLSFVIVISLAGVGLASGLIASAIFTSFGAALAWAMILSTVVTMLAGATVTNAVLLFFPNRFSNQVPGFAQIFLLGPV